MKIKYVRSIKTKVHKLQSVGRLLSSIIMPNIGAFITWGLLSAMFLPHGWWPNESMADLVAIMSLYLLPTLIGYTGGKVVYGHRGGVLGAITTMAMTAGAAIPMFFGAMLVGPIAAWLIKKFDRILEKRIPSGFEMLINNFSTGVLGCLLAIVAFEGGSPIMAFLVPQLSNMVEGVIAAGALPLAALVIEPAKILFLNNAINHGILSPLAMEQAVQTGNSILFLLETNPGPGLGILMAYWLFAKGKIKQSAPSAIIIHFLGGIHEIYFPYILMQPKLLLALIAGSASGVFTFSMMDAGLVAIPSPGSIISLLAMTPKGGVFAVLAGVLVSTTVSFFVGMLLINRNQDDSSDASSAELIDAQETLAQIKQSDPLIGYNTIPVDLTTGKDIHIIAVACDAGMGSSVMGASRLRKKFHSADLEIKVISCSIDDLDNSIDLVITHEKLSLRAHRKIPQVAMITITDFINTDVYQQLTTWLKAEIEGETNQELVKSKAEPAVLIKQNIKLGLQTLSKQEAISLAGKLLYEAGYVELAYVDAMQERELDCSTYMANGVAIPHGTSQARKMIKHSGICILQFPQGVDFDGNIAYLVIGIAAIENQHLTLLSSLASVIDSEELMQTLRTTSDQEFVYQCFTNQNI